GGEAGGGGRGGDRGRGGNEAGGAASGVSAVRGTIRARTARGPPDPPRPHRPRVAGLGGRGRDARDVRRSPSRLCTGGAAAKAGAQPRVPGTTHRVERPRRRDAHRGPRGPGRPAGSLPTGASRRDHPTGVGGRARLTRFCRQPTTACLWGTRRASTARRIEVRMHVVLFGSAFPGRQAAGVDRVHVRRALSLAVRVPVVVVVPTPWAPPALGGPSGRWARY